MTEIGNPVQFRKSRTFVAGLALNQNQPEFALSILEGETTYVTMRHIKLVAWARTSQFDKIFEMFRQLFKLQEGNKKFKPFTSNAVVSLFSKTARILFHSMEICLIIMFHIIVE